MAVLFTVTVRTRPRTRLERMYFLPSRSNVYQTQLERKPSASIMFERVTNATRTRGYGFIFVRTRDERNTNVRLRLSFRSNALSNAPRTLAFCIRFERVIKRNTNARLLFSFRSNALSNAARTRIASFPFERVYERNTNANSLYCMS